MTEEKKKWYKVAEASAEFGIDRSYINRAIREGKIKVSKISGSSPTGFISLIPEDEMVKFAKNHVARKTTITGVTDMTVDDLAEELLKRIKDAYDKGFKDGMTKAKNEYMAAIKGVKL